MMDGKTTGRNLEGTARIAGLIPTPQKHDAQPGKAERWRRHGDEARGEQPERLAREIPSDPDEAGRENRGGAEPDGSEHAPAIDILGAFGNWNGGPLGRVDDGVSQTLASRRGFGRASLAAYGDAVVPQVTEAIGRVVRRLDAALSERPV